MFELVLVQIQDSWETTALYAPPPPADFCKFHFLVLET